MSNLMLKLKPFAFALVGFFAAVGLLSFSRVGPAQAQSPGVNLAALVAQVNSLQSTVNSQGKTITGLQTSLASETTRATNAETALQARAKTLETKTAPLSVSSDPSAGGTSTLLTITGVNVQIVSGRGYTDDGTQGEIENAKLSGLGNLIIGYNATGNSSGDTRTGSHNLIVGDQNNYLSYGGLIAGQRNTISASMPRSAAADSTPPAPSMPRSAAAQTTKPATTTLRSAAASTTQPAATTPRSAAATLTRLAATSARSAAATTTRLAPSTPRSAAATT